MKQNSIFDYRDYKLYLKAWIAACPNRGRGERAQMAGHLRIHSAYISQVLKGSAHLSLEQALLLSGYLRHSGDERQFFLLLVERARAGSPALVQHFDEQLSGLLERRLNLKNRLTFSRTLNIEDQTTYYSSWLFSACYALASIPGFDSPEKFASKLGVSVDRAAEILEFLITRGLLVQEGMRIKPGTASIHLSSDSPMFPRHHANWRLESLRALERPAPESLHYSSVVSIAKKDVVRARSVLVRAIEEIRAIVRESPEEEVYSYALDLFRVGMNN